MENGLDSSAAGVDTTTAHATSEHSSAHSNTKITSYHHSSNSELLQTRINDREIPSFPNLKAFSFNELKIATGNFCPDSLLAKGGSGDVFKGWIDEITFTAAKPGSGMAVAVKKLTVFGHKEWLTEVTYLGQLHHPNLVKLIGYFCEEEKRFLVYEFMPKGSLEKLLFTKGAQPLSWAIRMKVAIDIARGLSFLNDAKSQIIYRDLKPSNILLDEEFNSKLSYFGFATGGPTGDRTHVSTAVYGTFGYADPEYIASGRLTAKSDVYSFGAVLLELLSGRPVVNYTKVGIEFYLVDWVKHYEGNKRKLLRIMDTRLGGKYPQEGAYIVATVALQCLSSEFRFRPRMSEVVTTLEQLESP